ncbi:MAG: CPBP family intramembrane metalloprotease [Candidatus Eisenbacteria bacterium]|uniref:CPBP family intramembrane metalloprotease n=1 Tax=Eiseniibacteriota bacterium TaxID=2212470 RepID=A0A7Y2H229_UNCEI|nr:CPBP family intramembrane metalloprotease [Candidatus Eisenbacteria bacterium]
MKLISAFVNQTRRPRAGWRIAIGLVAMMVVIAVLATAVDATEVPLIESFLWQLLAVPLLIGLAKLLARMDRRSFKEYGLSLQLKRLAAGLFLGVFLVGLIWLLLRGLGWIEVIDTFYIRYSAPFALGFLAFALRYASVGIFEELFHRGFLITNFAEGLNGAKPKRFLAAFLASVLFGLLHLTNDGATVWAGVNLILLGLVFALPFVWSGNLSFSIGLHAAWNFAMGPIFGMPVSGYEPRVAVALSEATGPSFWTGGTFGPEGGFLTTLILGTTLILFALMPRKLGKSGSK